MFSGVSGLRTHQTKMDVIAHNISNVNTVGFKSSRVTFNDVFSQTVQGASRANDNTGRGGTNAMQIGLGVNVASIDKNMSTGAAQRTDRALDVMINGDGFFIVSDGSGQFFTRAGAFEVDAAGNLHMNGMRVNGWDIDDDWNIVRDQVSPINLGGFKESSPPEVSTEIRVEGNLNADAVRANGGTPPTHISSISIFDSLGNRWVVEARFELGTSAAGVTEWEVNFGTQAFLNGDRRSTPVTIANPGPVAIEFDDQGRLIPGGGDLTAGSVTLDFGSPNFPTAATIGDGGDIEFDFSFLNQFGSMVTNASFDTRNGAAPGTLEGLSVGSDGIITGRYSNGDMRTLGQIAIATFRNPAGLEAVGNNLFATSPNSGEFNGQGVETSNIMGGVLEMSNVDLSAEFTEMITTQRGFQASSRLITTSDEMLQELVNLRR